MTEEIQSKGVSRRAVVHGAAWSVPVVATAAAVPMASASPTDTWDVGVTANCSGNYDLQGLFGLLEDIPGIGPVLGVVTSAVQSLLGAIGLQPVESRGFTITAVEGPVPAGTEFQLTSDAFINLGILGDLINAEVLGLVAVGGAGGLTLTLDQPLEQGSAIIVNSPASAVDVDLGGTAVLSLNGADNPSAAPGAPNSADLSVVSVSTNLGSLIDVGDIPGLGALGPILRPLISALTITLQLCPGQPDPT